MKELQKQLQQASLRFSVLNDISRIVNSRLPLDNMLDSIIACIVDTLEVDSARVYLVGNGGKTINLMAHKGLSDHFISQPHIRTRQAGDGLLGKTLATGKTIVVDSQSESICPYADQLAAERIQSTLYMPLATKGSPAGVLCISSFTARRFSSELVDFLDTVSNYIGLALDNAIMVSHTKKAYQELKDAQEQIVWTEKLASLGKLAATIAHEINNPLAGVLNYIRLMIKQVKRNHISRETLDNMVQYLNTIESEIARCGSIVKDLLAFARRSSISIESNSIEDIVDKTLNLISHDLELKHIQLKKIVEPNLPKINCDFKQIQQVLLNLMVNAADAMKKGGVLTVTVSAARGKEPLVEVAVTDTGSGIAQKDKAKIFDPFFTTKEEGKGVGLGLSVAYGIIAKHHGTIAVESMPGKGSTFKVRLPCA